MIKTEEEIQALKNSWLKDPCWDIEDQPGFEEHREELVRFRIEIEDQWKKKDAERLNKRVRVILDETGIDHPVLADSLYTFQEIENDLRYRTAEEENASSTESAQIAVMRAQVRATLLMAAQIMRVADLFEDAFESKEAGANLDFMTDLYKVD